MSPPPPISQLVSAQRLLDLLFDDESRPSVRWLRKMQQRRIVPVVRLGRLVFFDPDAVRTALARHIINPRS